MTYQVLRKNEYLEDIVAMKIIMAIKEKISQKNINLRLVFIYYFLNFTNLL